MYYVYECEECKTVFFKEEPPDCENCPERVYCLTLIDQAPPCYLCFSCQETVDNLWAFDCKRCQNGTHEDLCEECNSTQ